MEDDDLDYEITFPSPVAGESPSVLLDRKEPVVIVLGWMGCNEKYLSKYGQIYDERGCITIRYILPKDVVFFKPEKLYDVACKLLDLLKDFSIEDNPILFHIFSNNGSHVYADVVKVLTSGDERYKNLSVCGVIVDSAPGRARLSNAANAYAATLKVNPVLKFLAFVGLFIYLAAVGMVNYVISLINPTKKGHNKYYLFDTIANDPTRWPMLFLYSKSDKIIMYYDVEEMIQHRSQLGVHVDSVCFEGSDHVAHLRKHPEEYIEACERFLQFCLGIDPDYVPEEMDEEESEALVSKTK